MIVSILDAHITFLAMENILFFKDATLSAETI